MTQLKNHANRFRYTVCGVATTLKSLFISLVLLLVFTTGYALENRMKMDDVKEFLQECSGAEAPEREPSLSDEIIKNSDQFPIKFPIETIRCSTLAKNMPKELLVENIASTYPLIHEKVLLLMCRFLLHKRVHGSNLEKEFYKDLGIIDFLDRLLKKRSVAFFGAGDRYLLISQDSGMLGWEKVGSDEEKAPLFMKDCLTYEEMKLSAMLYVSGDTVFINNGNRNNQGFVESEMGNVETSGVIIGLIGTRFEKTGVMEYQEMVLDKKQNTLKNGYFTTSIFDKLVLKLLNSTEESAHLQRKLWADFYGEPTLTYEEGLKIYKKENGDDTGKQNAEDNQAYLQRFVYDRTRLFDNLIYAKHLSIPFDCAVLEASKRAQARGTTAYLHVVGIGLGVWRAFLHQNKIFIKTFLERLQFLAAQLPGLSDVHFAYFRDVPKELLSPEGTFITCDSHPKGGIKVHLSQREPSSKLSGEHDGKLLVETYPWDGNAQPGNEFWVGSLSGSGDPAAACSSQVAELHNSHINKKFVCGENVHVAGQHGIKHISEYASILLKSITC